jgi:hypothetical protein
LTAKEASDQGQRNSDLQGQTFGDITNPFYALIKPLPGQKPFLSTAGGKLKLNGIIIGTRKGLIPTNQIKDFERFLRGPLK